MSNANSKMLIDATHPEETRVVVQRNGRVEEFDFESAARKLLRGNIYLAKVTRVEPSLQAAFVDYGGNRHGFLAFNEIHPDYYQIPVADRIAILEEQAAAEAELEAAADRRADALARRAAARAGQSNATADGQASDETTVSEDNDTSADPDNAHLIAEADGDEDDGSGHIVELDDDEDDSPIEVVGGADDDSDDSETAGDDDAADEADSETPKRGRGRSRHSKLAAKSDDALRSEAVDEHDANAATDVTADASDDDGDGDGQAATDALSAEGDNDVTEGDETETEDDADDAASDEVAASTTRRPRRRMRSYKIQEVIKRRQIILVQVVKEERGNKGAALTTYLSLAGRYTVLMPNTARGGGISRKITNPQDRKRLKAIANDLDVPEGMGLIIRTAGASRSEQEIRRDFEYLLRLWESVREMTLQSTAPSLVYEEGDLIKRSIRDLYNKDVDEVVVAGDEACRDAADFMKMLMPSHAKNVTPYNDPVPLFNKYGVERQLNAMFQPQVTLRSGGYIVINQTEALVAIDVNSGKSTKEFSIEETALATNLEAADEIARQLKLRDLAGLVVIDFIDMEEKRNNRAVERRLKDALRHDRARIQLGRISHFGLMEMSRQRLRTGVLEGSTSQCPHCQGTGIIRSTESIALAVLRGIEDAITAGANTPLVATTTHEVALYILNSKRAYISEIESQFGYPITILGSDDVHGANFSVDKGAAIAQAPRRPDKAAVNMNWGFEGEGDDEAPAFDAGNVEIVGDGDDDGDDDDATARSDDGGRRRRRRRGRGGRGRGSRSDSQREETAKSTDDQDDDSDVATAAGATPDNDNSETTDREQRGGRRRRRGRRGGRRSRERRAGTEQDTATADGNTDSDPASELSQATSNDGDEPARSTGSRGKRLWDRPSAETVEASAEPGHGQAGDILDEVAASLSDVTVSPSDTDVDSKASRKTKPKSADTDAISIPISESGGEAGPMAPAVADAKAGGSAEQRPVPARHESGSTAPRIERVVVGPDSAPKPVDEAPPQQRKGWWQRRFSAE